jgi:signal transduction histidine kinase
MAQVALAQNRLGDAQQLSLKSIALNDRPGYDIENALCVKLELADVYSRKHDFKNMISVLRSCNPQVKQNNTRLELEWRRLMASYYEKTTHNDSTLHYYKSYFGLKDSLEEEQKQLMAADVARQLGEKERELQIAVLKSDKHIAVISLWVTIIFSCMSVVIIYLVYQNYRRSKKSLALSLALNEEIKRQKEAREEEVRQRHKLITEAVIKAQESERSLIGLELHDNINQVLTTVKLQNEMLLEGIGDPNIILPRTLKYLQECINEIRSLSKRLSAPTLGKISLEESVKDLIASINLASKVKIKTQISALDSDGLTKEVHIGLYRILQEQLNNVLKHADASEVVVRLERDAGKICLSVADNGKGFLVPGSKTGIGMINMQTRAESLSGTFVVKSRPGQGCQMNVVVPCF